MALKRKFDSEEVAVPRCAKQLKLVPFPSYEPDLDVAMSDDSSSPLDHTSYDQHHLRADSASSSSSGISEFAYPSFNIYPNPFFNNDGTVNTDSHNFSRYTTPPPEQRPVGILQPKPSFHHGNCTQIPKLRIACSSGTHGQRTMWSHCEQCGAIEMIDPDY
ncbi:hypothetical protein OF83DRAFT_1081180 [Amylostereum chailletii]|nr:hypothetical protein OF83DRAFT_1081180 [Amylostereum chailletii]